MTNEDKWAIGVAIGIAATVTIVGLAWPKKAKAAPKDIPRPTPDVPIVPPPAPTQPLRDTPPDDLGWYTRGLSFTIVTGRVGDEWYWGVFGKGAEDAPEGWDVLFSTQSQIVEGVEGSWFDARKAAERWVDEREPPPMEQEAPLRLDDILAVISEAWGKTLAPTWLIEGGAPLEENAEILGWYSYKGFWIRVDGLHDVDSAEGHPHGRVRWVVLGGETTPLASGFFGSGFSEVMNFTNEDTDEAAALAGEWVDGAIGAGGDEAAAAAVDAVGLEEGMGVGGLWGHITPIQPLPIKFGKKRKRE